MLSIKSIFSENAKISSINFKRILERSEVYNEPNPLPQTLIKFVDPTRDNFDFSNHRVKKTFIKLNSHHRR